MKLPNLRIPVILFLLLVFISCEPTTMQKAMQLSELTTPKAEINQNCVQPPGNLNNQLSSYIHPNCFKNIDRLGQWIGGTTTLSKTEDPSKHFAKVSPKSIGSGNKPVHLYIVAHGWAPGSRKEFNKAGGDLQWWSSDAPIKYQGSLEWQSSWAWTGTKGTKDDDLEISPNGLLQTIQEYAQKQSPEAETIILAYSWMDNSATVAVGPVWNSWEAASQSESYTNLNGMRLADAIKQATTNNFFANPKNKLHLIGHSHGSKVATVATLELQKQNLPVQHLSIFDSPENELTYTNNSANLLGFYFNKMKITPPASSFNHRSLFVESYISMFGFGYLGLSGSNINNVVQVGLDSDGVFKTIDASNRHSYAAIWYSNAWNVSHSKKYPSLGLGWPPVSEVSESNHSYYQKIKGTNAQAWDYEQWHLSPGHLRNADIAYQYSTISNSSIEIQNLASSGNVLGEASGTMVFGQSNGSPNTPAHFQGSFKANTKSLFGLSFNMRWDQAQVGDYVIVTVQSPKAKKKANDQDIALVFDNTAALKNNTWHPVAFNTYSVGREDTQFNIYYYPNPNIKNHPGKLHIKDFGYVKQTYDLK